MSSFLYITVYTILRFYILLHIRTTLFSALSREERNWKKHLSNTHWNTCRLLLVNKLWDLHSKCPCSLYCTQCTVYSMFVYCLSVPIQCTRSCTAPDCQYVLVTVFVLSAVCQSFLWATICLSLFSTVCSCLSLFSVL